MSENRGDQFANFMQQAEKLMAGRCSRGEAIRRQYANTLTYVRAEPPDAVVWPDPTADVMRAIKRALDPLEIFNPDKMF